MKKLFSFLLSLMLILTPVSVDAGAMDLIYAALNNRNKKSSSSNILWDIINPKKEEDSEQQVKIITNDEELKQVENDKIKGQLLGIDVSKWNGDINWPNVKKAGIQFAIIRAGYGQNTIDYQFKKNIQGCIDNDIYVGIYWFSYALNDDMAIKEAKKCIKVIEPYRDQIKLGVWFDYEYDSVAYATRNGVHINRAKCTSITYAFCKEITKAGYDAGIYTNLDFINNYYTKEILDEYDIWLAIWNNNVKSVYKDKCLVWQYTDNGRVKGIVGKVDMDIYYGDRK